MATSAVQPTLSPFSPLAVTTNLVVPGACSKSTPRKALRIFVCASSGQKEISLPAHSPFTSARPAALSNSMRSKVPCEDSGALSFRASPPVQFSETWAFNATGNRLRRNWAVRINAHFLHFARTTYLRNVLSKFIGANKYRVGCGRKLLEFSGSFRFPTPTISIRSEFWYSRKAVRPAQLLVKCETGDVGLLLRSDSHDGLDLVAR